MNKHNNLEAMKQSLIEKTQRKLSLNDSCYEYDEDLLGDYFDDAIAIIVDWKRFSDESPVLTGNYDRYIVQFIIESIVVSGIEGQSQSYGNGIKKVFYASPEANLKSSIPQSL